MDTLYFEKISQFDRAQEPVSVSIPFAKGRLPNAERFIIKDEATILLSQRRVLATWEDGSVKWLLVHFQPDLPGNRSKTVHFSLDGEQPDIDNTPTVSLVEQSDGIQVNTGPLAFFVPNQGFWPICNVRLNGQVLWGTNPFKGFTLHQNDSVLVTTNAPVDLTIEEAGPLRAVILISGKHQGADGVDYIDLRGRITAYAGKPYIEVEHQFIHKEADAEFALKSLTFNFRPETENNPHLALGEGFYRTTIQRANTTETDQPLSLLLNAETMLYQANEHYVDSFYGDFWAAWRDNQFGVAISHYQAHQHFPKQLSTGHAGITCSLYPADEEPAPVLQGMGKTHRLLIQFRPVDTPLQDVSTRSLQFQLPDHPALSREWYRENNPWGETFFPEKVPTRLMTLFSRLHDGRPAALGMFHFGDAPDAGYTDQGRGKGETVWVNNEYDRPHACTLFYGLSGQRRALDSAMVSARHWLDVDFCHYNADPLINGGLRMHDRYHATGKVIPSHQWVEGFLDYYFLTGRTEGLEIANSIADNVMRIMATPQMSQPGATAVREGGWALRAMVGMWLGTRDDKWRVEARRIVDMFLDWSDEFGLLAPYTSHSMPRVVFMISLTVNSFARYLLIEKDERIEKLIVDSMDDLVEHCIGPDGIFYYKELPSLRRYAPTAHALEALTYAYRITNHDRYLKIAARQFAALSDQPIGAWGGKKFIDPSGAVITGGGGGRIFADKYTSILIFASEAAKLGLLDWYEYPYPTID
ncbi:MAG: hypothetical protein AAF629_35150 [Chloroflexota bacterium]